MTEKPRKAAEMTRPSLRFSLRETSNIADRYGYSDSDASLSALKPAVIRRGHLYLAELQQVAQWKSPRSAGYVRKNSDEYVAEITGFALAARNERSRIESLTLLHGVGWPTASVILHFFHDEPYPILDYRAVWSVSMETLRQYSFDFWMRYVTFCRELATSAGVDMRTLDRALWQYAKEHQPKG